MKIIFQHKYLFICVRTRNALIKNTIYALCPDVLYFHMFQLVSISHHQEGYLA